MRYAMRYAIDFVHFWLTLFFLVILLGVLFVLIAAYVTIWSVFTVCARFNGDNKTLPLRSYILHKLNELD